MSLDQLNGSIDGTLAPSKTLEPKSEMSRETPHAPAPKQLGRGVTQFGLQDGAFGVKPIGNDQALAITMRKVRILIEVAPERGLEPLTRRLTAGCSTIELLWNPNGRAIYRR